MNKRVIIFLMTLLISSRLFGQTADVLVSQGRGFLVQQDAPTAKARFESAVSLSPNHPYANALLAITRLLSLCNTPEGSALLDRLGLSGTGRNPFNWQSEFPTNANGQLVLPANFSASEVSAFLKTNVIPAIRASETNFSKVTNANYTIALSSAETGSDNVVVDYGDIQMLRSLLKAAEYFSLTIYSWNLEAQLTTIQSYITNESLTTQGFFAAHPQFFTFSTTNDLLTAKAAFSAGVERYFVASALVGVRPQNAVRLFNLDPDFATDEASFRQTLADLTNSLTAPVVLVNNTNLTVNLAKHFNGKTSLRSMLPSFSGDGFFMGSLPDSTFGGLIQGWSRSSAEEVLAQFLNPVQQLTGSMLQSPRRFVVGFSTLANHYYSVERSTDLNYWESVADFLASGTNYNYVDTSAAGSPSAYYRLADLSKFFSIEGRVVDACSGLPISNAWVTTQFDPNVAVTDASGKFFLQTDEFPGFYNIPVYAFADGHFLFQQNRWAGDDVADYVIALNPASSPTPVNDRFANRIVLSGTSPSGSGSTCGATYENGELGFGNSVWYSWTAPFSGQVVISVVSDAFYPQVHCYVGNAIGSLSENFPSFGSVFNVNAGTAYQLSFVTTGASARFQFSIASQPTFTLATPTNGATFLSPASIQFTGSFTSPGSNLRGARFYANNNLIATTTNPAVSFVWSNVPPNFYYLSWEGEDSNNQLFSNARSITVKPGNDNFANRISLVGASIVVAGDNNLATKEIGEPNHGGGSGGRSLWWSWTAATNGTVTVVANGNNFNAQLLGVYTGLTVSNLVTVASGLQTDAGSQASFIALAGTTYQIAVDGFGAGTIQLSILPAAAPTVSITSPTNGQVFVRGQTIILQASATDADGTIQNVSFQEAGNSLGGDAVFPYQWTYTSSANDGFYSVYATALDSQGLVSKSSSIFFQVVPPPPANNHFTNRFQLIGSSLTTTGHNFSATKEVGEANHGGNTGGASTWWQWTPTSSGVAAITTSGSSFDTLLAVYQGTNVAALSLIASNNNDGVFQFSRVTIPVTAGNNYQIAVDGNFGVKGNINLAISMLASSASLAAALDTTNFVANGGVANWTSQAITTHDAIDAAQSGTITHDQETWIESVITGPGNGSFWWMVSSETCCDFVRFEIDGVQQSVISGATAWANLPFTLGTGTHTLRWRYVKDGSVNTGSDRGWVDQLTFTPTP